MWADELMSFSLHWGVRHRVCIAECAPAGAMLHHQALANCHHRSTWHLSLGEERKQQQKSRKVLLHAANVDPSKACSLGFFMA